MRPLPLAQNLFDAMQERIDAVIPLCQNLGTIGSAQRPQQRLSLMATRTWLHLPIAQGLPPPNDRHFFSALFNNVYILGPLPPDVTAREFAFVWPDARTAFGYSPLADMWPELFPDYEMGSPAETRGLSHEAFYVSYLYINAMRYCADLRNHSFSANGTLIAPVTACDFAYLDD